jgi:hypothetical protein
MSISSMPSRTIFFTKITLCVTSVIQINTIKKSASADYFYLCDGLYIGEANYLLLLH